MTNQQTTALVKHTAASLTRSEKDLELTNAPDFDATALQKTCYIPGSALKQGVHVMGGPGSGKSRLLGRVFAKKALIQQQPLIVIDPTGGVIDNLFDGLIPLPFPVQKKLWQRIVYIDAGNPEYVV